MLLSLPLRLLEVPWNYVPRLTSWLARPKRVNLPHNGGAWYSEGRSVFYELLFKRGEPIFYTFDLLWLNGEDLRQLPLLERKKLNVANLNSNSLVPLI